jgi:sortase (surface protein transpeptidase)
LPFRALGINRGAINADQFILKDIVEDDLRKQLGRVNFCHAFMMGKDDKIAIAGHDRLLVIYKLRYTGPAGIPFYGRR